MQCLPDFLVMAIQFIIMIIIIIFWAVLWLYFSKIYKDRFWDTEKIRRRGDKGRNSRGERRRKQRHENKHTRTNQSVNRKMIRHLSSLFCFSPICLFSWHKTLPLSISKFDWLLDDFNHPKLSYLRTNESVLCLTYFSRSVYHIYPDSLRAIITTP